ESRINVTTGKNDFYRFDLVYESLPKGVSVFESYGVDPWYAQSILLIESPGRMQKSISGAYGPFQLMPGVARSMGLVVNKYTDERKDFNRSAYAAAQLLKRICIPSARDIATQAGLIIEENAVWFRLLTMHVYHAGALNVKAVVTAIGKVNSGEELIQKMWITTAASFGNNSQNYSQLALAAHIELREYVEKRCKDVYNCGSVYTN
ncbi:MAG TPA: transglycosylase SLT domain-containing protein, partial [Fluviicola sp.]|nr:transglycosylase SLT domain-containing protein [Fluviicola sp.]